MYPVDMVDAYVRQAEATIARLQEELAAAHRRAANAAAALSGSLPPDAVEERERAVYGPASTDADQADPLEGFLDSLHKRD